MSTVHIPISRSFSLLLIAATSFLAFCPANLNAQDAKKEEAVLRGKIGYDRTRAESWEGNKLVIPYGDIPAKLRQRVTVPPPPLPAGFNQLSNQQKMEWEKKFVATEAGKKFLENKKRLIEAGHAFDLKFEKDGSFVVYDVPVGVYGIQGRVDKKIGDTTYGFEVFGQVEVLEDVDQLDLEPMRVEVTPLMKSKQIAPPVSVKTHDNGATLTLKNYEDKYLFINFWTAASPTSVQEQKLVQAMHAALKKKYPIKLLSINVDADRKKSLQYIISNRLSEGSHGFSGGVENRTLFDYGVRSLPSFWLIGQDGKILMSQYEIAQAMRVKPDITTIVSDRIEGKDAPTPAQAMQGEEKMEQK